MPGTPSRRAGGDLSEGEYLVQIMNKAGYDFAVPGNHEFDYGMEKLLGLSARLDCGYSACNFVNLPSKTQVFAPYRIMEYDDIQVAFVALPHRRASPNPRRPTSRTSLEDTASASVRMRRERLYTARYRVPWTRQGRRRRLCDHGGPSGR